MNREFTRAPHRAPETVPVVPVETAALLIDFDNVTMGIRSNLGQELRTLLDSDVIRSKIAVQRAYADWRRYPQYIVPLSEASIDLIFAPAYGSSKKNATDIRMAIDGLELVFTRPEIGTFILLTGDSDFSSLVLKLKEYGKYVIGVGLQESASDILVQNCDEYYSYNQVSGLVSAGEISSEKHDPWVLVSMAVRKMAERGDVMRSDRLKQVMLEIDSSFDEKGAGFAKFNRFLAEATHRDLIEMRKGQNGQYEVAPGSEALDSGDAPVTEAQAPAGTSKSAPSRNRRGGRGRSRGGSGRSEKKPSAGSGSGGRGGRSKTPQRSGTAKGHTGTSEGLEAAYDALVAVVADLYEGDGVRDSMAKRKLIARDSGFDEGGLGFAKFSLFLKQAAEDGVVELDQRADGNFYLAPAPEGKRSSRPSKSESSPKGGSPASDKPAKRGLLDRLLGKSKPESTPEASPEPRRTETRGRDTSASREEKTEAKPRDESKTESRGRQGGKQGQSRGGQQGRGGQQSRSGQQSRGGQQPSGQQSRGGKQSRGGQQSRDGGRGAQGQKGRAGERDRTSKERGSDRKPREERESTPRDGARDEGRPKQERAPREERPSRERASSRGSQRGSEKRDDQKPKSEPKPEAAKAESAPAAEEKPAAPEQRRLGRYRSGSRGRPTAKPSGSSTASRIGPVSRGDEPAGGKKSDKKPEKSEKKEPAAETRSGSDDAPRRGVRGRGGSRDTGGSRPADKKPETQKSEARPPSRSEKPVGPDSEAVEHMVRNYAGVGKRTAEVLVEHFGARVFEVIDSDPGRLTEVLSEGRARAVVTAREQERAE